MAIAKIDNIGGSGGIDPSTIVEKTQTYTVGYNTYGTFNVIFDFDHEILGVTLATVNFSGVDWFFQITAVSGNTVTVSYGCFNSNSRTFTFKAKGY